MRLCAIFNVWDDYELLRKSVDNIRPLVDGVIIIASFKSNYGEWSPIPAEWHNDELFVHEPKFHIPMHSETDKRNFGLDVARKKGYTHFLTMDADEFYEHEPFLKARAMFHGELKGLVCQCQTYFPNNLTMGLDSTLVPFIHELTPTIKHEFNRKYPFAWSGKQILIDPTRSLNINTGVEKIDLIMHHYSWTRKDLTKKIRNSTARANLERSNILTQVCHAKAGDYIDFYKRSLVPATVDFGINDTIFKTALCKDL